MTRDNKDKAMSDAERNRQSERARMRQLFLISYPLCLIAATGRRISGHHEKPAGLPGQSVFAEARSSAYAAVGYAFHG